MLIISIIILKLSYQSFYLLNYFLLIFREKIIK